MASPDTPSPTAPTAGPSASKEALRRSLHAPPRPPAIRGVPTDRRRAVVVGASSGIGAALVRRLASEGYQVAALARRGVELDELELACEAPCDETGGKVVTRVHDVLEAERVPQLFEDLVRELGGLDLFVYAAAIMPEVAADEFDTGKDLRILRVNTEGAIAWCNEAARYLATQERGTIVGVSSIAGDRGRIGNPAYCTSKAALDTYLEALRNRLWRVGVHVCTIKPGFVATRMTEGMEGLFWVAQPDEAARAILSAARSKANVRYVERRWWFVGAVVKLLPSFLFRRLKI